MSESPFSEDQSHALSCVLDQIIPPSAEANMPGAGEIGLVAYIERELEKSPDLLPTLEAGLAAIDELARGRGAQNFATLPMPQRAELLEELTATQPGFLPSLIFHTFVGYYQNAQVVGALGIDTHPPYPNGYEVELGDLSLLDAVKSRPKMFREV